MELQTKTSSESEWETAVHVPMDKNSWPLSDSTVPSCGTFRTCGLPGSKAVQLGYCPTLPLGLWLLTGQRAGHLTLPSPPWRGFLTSNSQKAESKQKMGPGDKNLRVVPSSPLPLVWLYLPKFPQPSKQSHQLGNKAFRHMSLWQTFHIQTTMLCSSPISWWPSHNPKHIHSRFKSPHSL